MSLNNFKVYKAGKLRGEKVTYKDGTGCCIWTPFPKDNEKDDEEAEEAGICFDFSASSLSDLKELAETLKNAEADIFIPDPKDEEFEEMWAKKEASTWYKITEWLENISFSISPFYWRFTKLIITRPVTHGNALAKQWCHGFYFGPFTVTWA